MSTMPMNEPTTGMIMTFTFTFSATCLSQIHILNFLLDVSRMSQVFKNQFIVLLPPKTFFGDHCFGDGVTTLGKPDAWKPFSVSSFPPHFTANLLVGLRDSLSLIFHNPPLRL